MHGRTGPGAEQQAGLQVLDVQLPGPAPWGLLALALQFPCGQAGPSLLHLPQALGVAGFQAQLCQGQALQVPGAGQQVLHLCIELPSRVIGQQPGLSLQTGLWRTGPKRGQVQRLPLALCLHHRLFLPGLDLGLQLQMNLVLRASQSALPGCGGQLGLYRELGLRA